MDTRQNPFSVYDIVKVTDISRRTAANNDISMPSGELTVLAVQDEVVVVSDGSTYHHSHFYKVGENPLKKGMAEAEAASKDDLPDCLEDFGEFNEAAILDELRAYVVKTYGQHYAKDGVQALSLISKRPDRGLNFTISNVIKYADRYGEKAGRNRADLLKIAHYAILAIHCHDQLEQNNG